MRLCELWMADFGKANSPQRVNLRHSPINTFCHFNIIAMTNIVVREFPASVMDKLLAYVYALFDPRTEPPVPFYIGKGNGNRVFAHAAGALDYPKTSDKLDVIRDILSHKLEVKAVILRHGMSDPTALEVECALIDLCRYVIHIDLTNIQGGHGSHAFGSMTPDEVVRRYEAPPLDRLEQGCVLININKTYRRAKGSKSYYEATKEFWKMDESITKLRCRSLYHP